MRRRFGFCLVGFAVLLDAWVCHGQETGDDVETKRKIFAAWSQRQETLKSFQCQGTLVRQGSVAHMEPSQRRTVLANYPEIGEFLETTHHFSVKIDGQRFDHRMDTVDAEKSNGLNGYRGSYDGIVSQVYSGTLGKGSVGTGVITGKKHAYGPNDLQLRPIILFLRPLQRTMGGINDKYRCLPQRESIGGVSAIVLKQTGDHPSLWKYWIDPDRDYRIVRMELAMEESNAIVDIEYERNPDYGMIPKSWKAIQQGTDGTVFFRTNCTLSMSEFNQPIAEEEFTIEFPEGTHVEDRVLNKKYIVGDEPDPEP